MLPYPNAVKKLETRVIQEQIAVGGDLTALITLFLERKEKRSLSSDLFAMP